MSCFKKSYGNNNQVVFNDEHEFYKAIGYLANPNRKTSLVLEHNERQGAWAEEGRIHFFEVTPAIDGTFSFTKGTGNIKHRVNCNDFVQCIIQNHAFQYSETQNDTAIRATVPAAYLNDFNYGYNK